MTARSMSLRLRLFVVILTPLLAVSLLLGVWRYSVAQATAEGLFDRGLLAAALAISRDVIGSGGDALSPRTRQLISDAGGGDVFYHVTGPGGIYVTGYAYPPVRRAGPSGEALQYSAATYRGEPVRVLQMTETTTLDTLTGETIVTVWQRDSDRDAFAAALARRAALLIAGLMAALGVVVWFGVGLGLRPLNNLQNAIALRSPDDLGRIQRPVPVEVSGIVETLNHLLGEVRHRISAHQTFISDAAHQLRNPASAILALSESLPGVTDANERRTREQELISAARKAARLADQLLSLERLRYDDDQVRAVALDLNTVAGDASAGMGPEVLGRDLRFEFAPSARPLPVRGDPVLIAEAIGNLIDNALQHGGPTLRSIRVVTGQDGDLAAVSVEDDGRGLPPEAADRAFRRFGQLVPGDGSGLGLAIVKEVATRHGGTAMVEPCDRGARITLRLPLDRDSA